MATILFILGLGATGGREAMCTVRAGSRRSGAAVRAAATVARTPSQQPAWPFRRPRPPTDGLPGAASSTDPQGKTTALTFTRGCHCDLKNWTRHADAYAGCSYAATSQRVPARNLRLDLLWREIRHDLFHGERRFRFNLKRTSSPFLGRKLQL